jgi:hypothetical protein
MYGTVAKVQINPEEGEIIDWRAELTRFQQL